MELLYHHGTDLSQDPREHTVPVMSESPGTFKNEYFTITEINLVVMDRKQSSERGLTGFKL